MLAMSKMDNGKRIEAARKLKQLHASPRSTGILPPPPKTSRVACGRSVDAADASIRLRTRGRSDMEKVAHKYACRRRRPSSPCEGKDCPIVIQGMGGVKGSCQSFDSRKGQRISHCRRDAQASRS